MRPVVGSSPTKGEAETERRACDARDVSSSALRDGSIVVLEHPAESFVAADVAALATRPFVRLDQLGSVMLRVTCRMNAVSGDVVMPAISTRRVENSMTTST